MQGISIKLMQYHNTRQTTSVNTNIRISVFSPLNSIINSRELRLNIELALFNLLESIEFKTLLSTSQNARPIFITLQSRTLRKNKVLKILTKLSIIFKLQNPDIRMQVIRERPTIQTSNIIPNKKDVTK